MHCMAFSSRWLLLLQVPVSGPCRHCGWGTQALEPRLSSCGAQAQVPCGTQNLPEPGIKPVSLRRQGLLAPGPLGQSLSFLTTHSTAGGTAALSPELLLSPRSQEDGAEQSRSALHTQWVCCMAEETHAQEPWSSKGDIRQTAHPLPWRLTWSLLCW